MSQPNIIPFPAAGQPARAADRPTMRSDLLEQASQVVPDIPVLINMISQRVRQLNNGRPPLVRVYQRVGQADIALMEIIQGKIVLVEGSAEERF
jgi:DNA-directed RNA polymerase subunit omega